VSSAPTERKLAAILSADVVGYSRLMAVKKWDLRTSKAEKNAVERMLSTCAGGD